MHCPRCQHENRPQARFCEECASPFKEASPTTQSYADLKTEVESLRRALTESVEQQPATSEILDYMADPEYRWPGQRGAETRTNLAVPMLREAAVIGVIFPLEHQGPVVHAEVALKEVG